jgi:dihydrofolate synthase/folylpolyglutamate synthase
MQIEPTYQKTLDYLYSYVDYSLTKASREIATKFDLERMRKFMQRLGNPQQDYLSIHVAGTKGKGSVSALCASALAACGYRVGLYTSPHLEDYSERIQMNGKNIPHAELVALIEEMKPVIETTPEITTFEITTALGLLYFSKQKADVAVIEVGLGGRLDATNIVIPIVSVITSISYDHTAILGDTLDQIAGEKGGIIKTGVPVILAPQPSEARLRIESIAFERGAPLVQVGQDWQYQGLHHSLDGQALAIWRANQPVSRRELPLRLLGVHQVKNAAVAYAALDIFNQRGLPVSINGVIDGFQHVHWPARFDILRRDPPLVVDSAHNLESAQVLVQALTDYFPGQEVVLIFGASEDKDIEGMFSELLPKTARLIITKSFHPRAANPQELQELASRYPIPVDVIPEVSDALESALAIAGSRYLVLAAGSVFIAAGVRAAWRDQQRLAT